MPYTKPVQTAYAANLAPGEFVVKLDTTPQAPVAVRAAGRVDPNTGNIVAQAWARVVKADGTDYLDVNNQPLYTTYVCSLDRAGVAAMGGIAAFKKAMLLTLIGEPAGWINPPAQDVLDHASIRANIASAIDAANAADPGSLL